MPILQDLSIRTRHLLMAGLAVLGVGSCTLVGLLATSKLTTSSATAFTAKDVVADILPPPMYLIEMRLVLSQAHEGVLSPSQARAEIDRLEKEYRARVQYWTANPPFGLEQDLLGAQHRDGLAFIQAARRVIDELGQGDMSIRTQAMQAAQQAYAAHRRGVDVTVTSGNRLAGASMAEFEQSSEAARRDLILILLLGLLGTFALARAITRSISRPLDHAVAVAEACARGDLTVRATVVGRDEISRLLTALNAMSASLHHVLGDVRLASLAVATASSQMRSSSNELLERSQRQHADLATTRDAIEGVRQLVEDNSQAARHARDLAGETHDVAARGVDAVARMVEMMKDVERLSAAVSTLVDSIEGVAFQTRLLALNASVEAARASDHGRGFAVVAAEVRQLAGRTSGAASQIRERATDCDRRVSTGSEMTGHAHEAINAMTGRVQEMSQLVERIWESTFAQGSGINLLSESIDGVVASNASNLALVQQATQTAAALDDQARRLAQVLARFRMDQASPLQAIAAPEPIGSTCA